MNHAESLMLSRLDLTDSVTRLYDKSSTKILEQELEDMDDRSQ